MVELAKLGSPKAGSTWVAELRTFCPTGKAAMQLLARQLHRYWQCSYAGTGRAALQQLAEVLRSTWRAGYEVFGGVATQRMGGRLINDCDWRGGNAATGGAATPRLAGKLAGNSRSTDAVTGSVLAATEGEIHHNQWSSNQRLVGQLRCYFRDATR